MIKGLLKLAWVTLSIVVLIATWRVPDVGEGQMAMWICMLVLTFPSGIAVALIVTLLGRFVLPNDFLDFTSTSRGFLVVYWITLFICGYLQWFGIWPSMIRRFRKAKHSEEIEERNHLHV